MNIPTEVNNGGQSRSVFGSWYRRNPPDLRLPLDGSLNNHALSTMPKAPERIRAEYERLGSPRVLPAVVRQIAKDLNLHERQVERVLINLPPSQRPTAAPAPNRKEMTVTAETLDARKLHGFTRPHDLTTLQAALWNELFTRELSPAVKVTEAVAAQISRKVGASGPQSIWAAQRWLAKKLGVRLRGAEPESAPEAAPENQAVAGERVAAVENAACQLGGGLDLLGGCPDCGAGEADATFETAAYDRLKAERDRLGAANERLERLVVELDADHRECIRLLTEAGADTSGATLALNLAQLLEERAHALAELQQLREQLEEQRNRFQQQWRTANRYEVALMPCLLRHPNGEPGETPLEDRLVTALQATVAELEVRKPEVRLVRSPAAPEHPWATSHPLTPDHRARALRLATSLHANSPGDLGFLNGVTVTERLQIVAQAVALGQWATDDAGEG